MRAQASQAKTMPKLRLNIQLTVICMPDGFHFVHFVLLMFFSQGSIEAAGKVQIFVNKSFVSIYILCSELLRKLEFNNSTQIINLAT